MPDQLVQFGVPGINSQGKVVPFLANQPWINLPDNGGGGTTTLQAGIFSIPGSPARYYIDTFGSVHLQGAIYNNPAAASPIFLAALPANCIPAGGRQYFPAVYWGVFPGLDTGSIPVPAALTVYDNGGYAVVRLQIQTPPLPLLQVVPINIEWETS